MKKYGKKGQSLWEYALLMAFISLVCIYALTGVGAATVGSLLNNVSGSVTTVEATINGSGATASE